MRQLFAVLLICSVACAGASSTVLTDADDFARGFFESFGADISECLGQTELAQIAQKFDDIKNDFSSGTFFQKLLHAGEDVYGLSELLKQQGQQCDVVQIAELFKNFDATVKADGGIKNLIPVIMQEHMMDVIGAIRQIAEGIKGKDFQSVGVAFGQLWQALFDAVQSSSFENFNEDSITAFIRAFEANIFQDAESFARGFFGGFGANPATCLDDSDVQNIINAFNNIKAALAEKGVAKYITLAENVYTFAQDLRAQLKNCDVMTIENEVKSFMAALKADGAKKILLAFAEEHFQAVFSDAKDIFVGLKDHDYETIGSASGNLLSDLLKVSTPTMTAFASTTPTALTDAKQFLEGFFTNFGANVDTCVSTSDLESMKSALDEIKAAVSAHGLVHKIEGVVMGVESLASLLKAQAQACGVTSLETTITKFITAIKTEGVEKVALEAVLHHGLSLIADGKDIYQGIKTQNYNEIGMATGAILNDIADDQFEFFYIGYNDTTTIADATAFAKGFFAAFGADVSSCLSTSDVQSFVTDLDDLKAAFKSKNMGEIIASGIALYGDIKTQADSCDVKQIPELVELFIKSVKKDGIERVLVNAVAVNLSGLVKDAKNLIAGFGSKNYEKIGLGFGGLMKDLMGADTSEVATMMFAAQSEDSEIASDVKTLLQGFFNAWGANIETCMSNAEYNKFVSLVDSVRSAWASGNVSIVERLEKTVLAVYSAWNLIKQEAQQCDISKVATQVAHFEAAIKANGWEKTLLPVVEGHAMDLIQDGEQVVQGLKSHNYELIGQAVGNVIRDVTDVPAPSFLLKDEASEIASDAKTLLQGFFNAWGANIDTCLSTADYKKFVSLVESVRSAWTASNTSIVERLEKTVISVYAAWDLIKAEAQECDITKVATQVSAFEAAVKANGFEKTILPALKNHMMDLIQDGEQVVQGLKSHNFELIGQAVGNVIRDVTDVPAPSMTFAAVSPSDVSDARELLQGFFNAWGSNIETCLSNSYLQQFADALNNVKTAWESGSITERLEKTVLSLYSAWNLLKTEAQQCDVTKIATQLANFEAAVKANGVEKTVLPALKGNMMDFIQDAQQIMQGMKTKNFELLGQAFGNIVREITDVPAPSMYSSFAVSTSSTTLTDAREFAQGFFGAFGANVSSCLDASDMSTLMQDIDALKAALAKKNMSGILGAAFGIYAEIKGQAQKCDVKEVPALVKQFIGSVKQDGIERVVANAFVINLKGFIGDAKNLIGGITGKNFEKIGAGVGGLMVDLMNADSPSTTAMKAFVAVAPATTDAQDFAQGFFSAFGADVSQCLDNADMQKIEAQLEDIKEAVKGNPVVALVKVIEDIKEILGEFKSEATACDVTSVESMVKEIVTAAKEDGVEKFVLSALLEHGLNMLENVRAGIDAFKAKDFEGAGKAIGNVIIDLKPNQPSQFVAGFLA